VALNSKQIRNLIGGAILLVLFILFLAWLGAFEGKESDEQKIRALNDQLRQEISDHDWEDVIALSNLSADQRSAYKESIPRQANLVIIDAINPIGLVSVPEGATEYQLDVQVLAHLALGGVRVDAPSGTIFYVKEGGHWKIDLRRSAATFPGVPVPP